MERNDSCPACAACHAMCMCGRSLAPRSHRGRRRLMGAHPAVPSAHHGDAHRPTAAALSALPPVTEPAPDAALLPSAGAGAVEPAREIPTSPGPASSSALTVSHICSLICLPSMFTIRAPNSTPMVRSCTGWKRLSVNWRSRHDLPTPARRASSTPPGRALVLLSPARGQLLRACSLLAAAATRARAVAPAAGWSLRSTLERALSAPVSPMIMYLNRYLRVGESEALQRQARAAAEARTRAARGRTR